VMERGCDRLLPQCKSCHSDISSHQHSSY
jgi:hypothetical protein